MAESGSGTTASAVTEAAKKAFGSDVEIGNPWKLAGGAVNDSWAVDAAVNGIRYELVVRVCPAGRADQEKTMREFEVVKVMWERGVCVPQPFIAGMASSGESYVVMTRMPGESNPRKLTTEPGLAHARERLVNELAEQLALIHTVMPHEVDAPGMRGPEPGEDPLAFQRRQVEADYHTYLLNPHPAIEWAFRWIDRTLERIREPGRRACVVHGDFRIGNLMYDESGLTAVLDWEGVHIGEPEEELAWFCTRVWRFARQDLEAGGIARREDWVRAYEVASGRQIDRERLAAWEVLQNIRWAEITMMQARAHLDGHSRSHELAAIGRRTAETELEILRLTGVAERVRDAG
jgi:aminoglycoside phosphotransferase (APT) family kinase protein